MPPVQIHGVRNNLDNSFSVGPYTYTAGNLIVISVATRAASLPFNVASSGADTPIEIGHVDGFDYRIGLWYAKNIVGGAQTFTFNTTAGSGGHLCVAEYAGYRDLDLNQGGSGADWGGAHFGVTLSPAQADLFCAVYGDRQWQGLNGPAEAVQRYANEQQFWDSISGPGAVTYQAAAMDGNGNPYQGYVAAFLPISAPPPPGGTRTVRYRGA